MHKIHVQRVEYRDYRWTGTFSKVQLHTRGVRGVPGTAREGLQLRLTLWLVAAKAHVGHT